MPVMIEPIHDHPGDLLARIEMFIETGGRLTENVLAYIETALFPPTPGRLAAFLSDDTDCERDSLLDLIFSPDQAVQVDLEPLLEKARYTLEDEALFHDRLMARAINAPVDMPDGSPLVRVQVPGFIKSQYLARLNIAWQLDSHVAAAIESGVSAGRGPAIKVRLRNAGIRFTSCLHGPSCAVFSNEWRRSDSDYLACLDLVLSLLETAAEGADVIRPAGRTQAHPVSQPPTDPAFRGPATPVQHGNPHASGGSHPPCVARRTAAPHAPDRSDLLWNVR
jgi:hypothetical protein